MTAPVVALRDHSAVMEVTVIGACKEYTYEAIIDTGFTNDLVVPVSVAIMVGLEKVGAGRISFADGSSSVIELYSGRVRLGSRVFECTVFPMGSEVLIGMGLLSQYTLCVGGGVIGVDECRGGACTREFEDVNLTESVYEVIRKSTYVG